MATTDYVLPGTLATKVAEAINKAIGSSVYCATVDALTRAEQRPPRFILDAEVERRTGLSNKNRRQLEEQGSFPRRVPLSERTTGWLEEEVETWIAQKLAKRDEALRKRKSPNPLAKENRRELAKSNRRTAQK